MFSDAINFTRFDYDTWNFTNVNKNITDWSISNDFTHDFAALNSTAFKYTFRPKTWTFFSNTSFCITVEPEVSNSLQFSAQWFKLAPSVYTQSSCAVIYACHPFCTACEMLPRNCSTCGNTIRVGSNSSDSQIYKVDGLNQCEVICPTGYFSHLSSKLCLSCAIHCPNITITGAPINGGESLEFTYTFTEDMNWSGFVWQDFLSFNCTNTSINIVDDFNYVLVPVNTLSFKIKLTPKPTKYLVASTVCT